MIDIMKATVLDLRYRMKDVLRAIERGESVTVLHRGVVKARISPITKPDCPKAGSDKAFGMWKDRKDLTDPAGYVRALRKPRKHDV
jgi:antitoxin (DNA-binding transcriptional repressor) of toxin-antitoxin stability system